MDDINTANSKPHITQVDYIRAIASLCVVLYHLGGKVLPVLNYGWLGVYMFFLLSGFIICWAIPQNYSIKLSGKFICKRLLRIEPPYVVSILMVLIAVHLWVPNYTTNWQNVLFHLAYINNFTGQQYINPVYWTLGIEFQFYLFVALFYPVIHHKVGPFVILALCLLPVFHIGSNLISFFPVFALGLLYFQYKVNLVSTKVAFIVGMLITICGLYSMGWLQTGAGVAALMLLILPLNSNKLISFFSKISFSLYLTHDIVGSRLVVYLGSLLPKTFMYKGFEFLTGIAISIAFAYAFYLAVERPCLRLSKRIKYTG